jgi:hypothetical protein
VLTKDYASVVEVITSVLTVPYLNRRHVPDLHQHHGILHDGENKSFQIKFKFHHDQVLHHGILHDGENKSSQFKFKFRYDQVHTTAPSGHR